MTQFARTPLVIWSSHQGWPLPFRNTLHAHHRPVQRPHLDDTLPLLAAAGIEATENPDKSRKLIIPTTRDDVRLLIVRATDVPTYVEHGAADLASPARTC